jgi:hypothetical protein
MFPAPAAIPCGASSRNACARRFVTCDKAARRASRAGGLVVFAGGGLLERQFRQAVRPIHLRQPCNLMRFPFDPKHET